MKKKEYSDPYTRPVFNLPLSSSITEKITEAKSNKSGIAVKIKNINCSVSSRREEN